MTVSVGVGVGVLDGVNEIVGVGVIRDCTNNEASSSVAKTLFSGNLVVPKSPLTRTR